MKPLASAALILSCAWLLQSAAAGDDKKAVKEALQELQDYIGPWKGRGNSEKDRASLWSETADWSWRFKDKDVWLSVDFPEGRHLRKGEMRYLPDRELYQLTAKDKDGNKLVFEGELKRNRLLLERIDPKTKEKQQIALNTAGGGIRFVMIYSVKPANRTLYYRQYMVAFTKEGESFAAAAGKKVECIVTGGLGTIPVSYKGATYYVCCSGCRDAFNENPERYVKEFLKRKRR